MKTASKNDKITPPKGGSIFDIIGGLTRLPPIPSEVRGTEKGMRLMAWYWRLPTISGWPKTAPEGLKKRINRILGSFENIGDVF